MGGARLVLRAETLDKYGGRGRSRTRHLLGVSLLPARLPLLDGGG